MYFLTFSRTAFKTHDTEEMFYKHKPVNSQQLGLPSQKNRRRRDEKCSVYLRNITVSCYEFVHSTVCSLSTKNEKPILYIPWLLCSPVVFICLQGRYRVQLFPAPPYISAQQTNIRGLSHEI
jgi:hypothetical protein